MIILSILSKQVLTLGGKNKSFSLSLKSILFIVIIFWVTFCVKSLSAHHK